MKGKTNLMHCVSHKNVSSRIEETKINTREERILLISYMSQS